jgi:Helix-turn-helix domain
MSINVMALVFKAKIDNIQLGGKAVTAPLLKLILLALADHANDDGDGAYPSLSTLEKKTALTHKSVLNSLEALKQQGLIIRAGISRRGTTNYSINVPMLRSLVFQSDAPLFAGKPGALPETSSEPGPAASVSGSKAGEPGTPEPSLFVHKPFKGDGCPNGLWSCHKRLEGS